MLDVKTGKRITTIPIQFELEEDSDSTAAGAFASEGATCFVMDSQGVVTAYQTKDWTPLGQPMKHPAAESAYEFGFEASKDGKWLVTFDGPGENGPQGQLQVWDAVANKALGEPLSAVNGMDGRFLPGQNRVLVRSGRGEATVRDLPSMNIAYVIKQHDEIDGPKVEVFPNGKWLIAWGPDKEIDLIDAATGKVLKTHLAPAAVTEIIIPSDSSSCFIGFDNGAFSTEGHYDSYCSASPCRSWNPRAPSASWILCLVSPFHPTAGGSSSSRESRRKRSSRFSMRLRSSLSSGRSHSNQRRNLRSDRNSMP